MEQSPSCEMCGKKIAPLRTVWLAHRISSGTYHTITQATEDGWFDTIDNEGVFPFSVMCAGLQLTRTQEILDV